MRGGSLILLVLGGCNLVFGLEPEGGDGDADAGADAADDAPIDARTDGIPGFVWALNIDHTQAAVPVRGYDATAHFGPSEETCVEVLATQQCRVTDCSVSPPPASSPDSGTITVDADLLAVAMAPDGSGRYGTSTALTGGLFTAGTTVGVYSTGGSVPALDATVIAPDLITFTAGNLPSGTQPATVPRIGGLPLVWPPAPRGVLSVVITTATGRRLDCSFPGSAGTAVIPAAGLVELPAGPGTLWSYSVQRDRIAVDAYDVDLILAHTARRSDGEWARGAVMLQ